MRLASIVKAGEDVNGDTFGDRRYDPDPSSLGISPSDPENRQRSQPPPPLAFSLRLVPNGAAFTFRLSGGNLADAGNAGFPIARGDFALMVPRLEVGE